MDRKPDIFEKIAYLGIAIATAKMYVDLHSGRIQSPLGPVLCFFIDFALYYLIYRAGRFVWRKWIKVRVGQEDCAKEPGSASQSEHTFIAKTQPLMDLQAINDYVLSYLGPFLQDEEKDLLNRNIQAFASSDHPELSPILDRKINGYGLYDIYHLCHAIGYHVGRKKNGSDISHFIKVCFPAYTACVEESTIRCKLTSDEGDITIPVVPRKADITRFRLKEKVISS